MFVIVIPILIYLSGLIDIYLVVGSVDITNIKEIILNITKSKNHLLIYIMLQILVALYFYFLFNLKKENMYKSDVIKVTDTIETPIAVGQGQYGTQRWLTKEEFNKIFYKNKLYFKLELKDIKFKKAGLVIGYKNNKKNEEIYCIDNNTHSLTVGMTRSGKTRTIVLQTIANLGLGEESIIISDPKGELYNYTSDFMRKIGYDVFVLDFKNQLKSNKYNFLQPIIDCVNQGDYIKAEEYSWDITVALVGTEQSNMDKIWKDGEMSIIAGTIMAVVYENRDNPEYQNLTNVYTFIAEMCRTEDGEMPLNEYINNLSSDNPATRIFNIARIAPDKTRSSFFTSALTTLRLFTSESIYSMTSESDFRLSDLGKNKIAIYIILPDERDTYYSLVSLFVNQQYVSLVAVADKRGGMLERRVNFVLDEFGNFTAINGFSNMLTVGGGRRIRFNIFLQGFAQLEQKYGKEGSSNILDNCETWIYLKASNDETSSKIMKKLGNYTTSSYSKSTSFDKHQNGNNSESMNLISRPLLTEGEIERIERPYILVLNTGNYPIITKIPDLSKWRFNTLLGLGDEEHNRIFRKKVENEREETQFNKMKLWGIWEEYR